MIFEAGFLADNTYGVKHINRLVRSLVTKGIVDYPFAEDEGDIGSYNINGFIQFLSEDGVIPETHKSMLVEKTDTGYILNPGMAFLDNGIYIFIETAQEFSCEPLMKVYWMHDTLTDKVEFVCAADYPASGSYLPLAEIFADGTVSNVRKCARAKLPGMVSDYNRAKKIVINQELDFSNNSSVFLELDLGGTCFKHLLFVCQEYTSWAIIDLETFKIRNTWIGTSEDVYTSDFEGNEFYLSFAYTMSGNSIRRYKITILEISEEGNLRLKIHEGTGYHTQKNVAIDIYAF